MARISRLICCFLILLSSGIYAQSTLNNPDEGGIGGTGISPDSVDIFEPPEVPDVDEMIPDIDVVDDIEAPLDGVDATEPTDTEIPEPDSID